MNFKIVFCVLFISFVILPSSAFAYLDPGTGSAILQGIIGALAAMAIVLKLYWHRLLRFLGIRKKVDTPAMEQVENNHEKTD